MRWRILRLMKKSAFSRKSPLLFLAGAASASMLLLGGCATYYDGYTIGPGYAPLSGQVVPGKVVEARVVKVSRDSGFGSFFGGVAGGTAGSYIGGGTRENILGAVGGVIIGSLVGDALERAINRGWATEYIVKADDGAYFGVVDTEYPGLRPGNQVYVMVSPSGEPMRLTPVGNYRPVGRSIKTNSPTPSYYGGGGYYRDYGPGYYGYGY